MQIRERTSFLYARRKGFLEATEKIYSTEKGNYVEMDFWSFYRNGSPDKFTRKGSPEKTLQKRIYIKSFLKI